MVRLFSDDEEDSKTCCSEEDGHFKEGSSHCGQSFQSKGKGTRKYGGDGRGEGEGEVEGGGDINFK